MIACESTTLNKDIIIEEKKLNLESHQIRYDNINVNFEILSHKKAEYLLILGFSLPEGGYLTIGQYEEAELKLESLKLPQVLHPNEYGNLFSVGYSDISIEVCEVDDNYNLQETPISLNEVFEIPLMKNCLN